MPRMWSGEMKGGDYYVADCWVTGDELDVWFDANANWVMTENELDSIDQLVPAVYPVSVIPTTVHG